jgi:signal transduction histidine kinase
LSHSPSLRRRFATWFGAVFILGAVAIRVSYFQATVAMLARDLDELLWARLAGLTAVEQLAPDSPLRDKASRDGRILPEPIVHDEPSPVWSWLARPDVDPGEISWFAGVWSRGGERIDGISIPDELAWDPAWWNRTNSIWTTADGRYRLAATAADDGLLLVVGADRSGLAVAARRVARFEVFTFFVWVPVVVGVAWVLFSRVLVPLSAVTALAHRIRTGHFEERIDPGRTDAEFQEMVSTINDMLDRLEAIRQSQSRFNADVAHQLMNPVHAILLETDVTEPRHEAAAWGGSRVRIHELANRIGQICEVLLAYSRSAALDPSRLKPVDLEPIVAAAIDRVEPRAKERGLTIEPPPGGPIVKGDASLLEEVFVNLLVNAVEHGPAGSSVAIVPSVGSSGCRIAVVDRGPGVAEADLPKLFERFHSGKPSGGHGVGLALSRLIMRSHGGDIEYTPTPGGGATFTLRFPPLS